MKKTKAEKNSVEYFLNKEGSFVIENYNQSKTFSNFFPGVAGIWGTPMWVFYVNRGQCISSCGIESKDKAILEFHPANKAYRLASSQGYRTFLKIKYGSKTLFWEPFQDNISKPVFKTKQKMTITAHDLTIEDINLTLGIIVRVNYFTIPEEEFPALVRRVTVENISRKKYDIELIDGLPMIMPYGMNDWVIKNMSRTVEAWVKVRNLKQKAPYYHLNVEVNDIAVVKHIKEGNFYFSFDPASKTKKLLDPIVEAEIVFGPSSDFAVPKRFLEAKKYRVADHQQTSNRTPCAMSFSAFKLVPRQKKEIVSLIGSAHNEQQLNKIVRKATTQGFVEKKFCQNKDIIEGIKNYAFTNSSSPVFDQYCGNTFLDNALRGGLPVSLHTGEGNIAFNVFSRKHGDPERDYNYFLLSPTHFSQGNGNYRDVNQNRRNDVWFNPDVKDSTLITFLSLSQVDGYNPLVVKGLGFAPENMNKVKKVVFECVKGEGKTLCDRIQQGFQPGELLQWIAKNNVHLKVSSHEFLGRMLNVCHKNEQADHGEGFWADHWTYNLDLIESFLGRYPEELRMILLEKKGFHFYHDIHYMLPRDQRYVLTPNGVRQYHSVKCGTEEIEIIDNKLRTKNGKGPVYLTTLVAKLLCLIANKSATLDPSGIGIEMEGGKPNWYDALNGLPGLLGSSISETLELKRYCLFLLDSLVQLDVDDKVEVKVFEELYAFIKKLKDILQKEKNALVYWQKSNDVKEAYRVKVRQGINGAEKIMTVGDIRAFLQLVVERMDGAIAKAKDKRGLLATYFYHDATSYKTLGKKDDVEYVLPLKFKKHALPFFLEGFVHALRTEKDPKAAKKLAARLKSSPLYDKELKMYKVNANLDRETEEIGRTRIFPSGWLENESIWLHMEYKYFLELLRCELYDEYYEAIHDALVPFLDPARYGRSTLENSSFIVSSAHEDEALHGQGFVARLSGSTAEFVHMWMFMNVGKNPFICNADNELTLQLKPVLSEKLFTKKETTVRYLDAKGRWVDLVLPKDTYSFNFLGDVLVVYHNPSRKDTFGKNAACIQEVVLTYPNLKFPVRLKGGIVGAPYAQDIRNHKVSRVDVFFS